MAKTLADTMLQKFWDDKNGGLYLSHENSQYEFIRMKSAEDINSLPSANSFAVIALNELAMILEEKNYSDQARKIIGCFSHYASENPLACISLLTADLIWKPVKKKPEPVHEVKPIPTDEELNAPEPELTVQNELKDSDSRRAARAARRERAERTATSDRAERAERRSARAHRTARTRER